MKHEPTVLFHSSEDMSEVVDGSAKLILGASVYIKPPATWDDYENLYYRVYHDQAFKKLRDDGYLVVIQTDAYAKNQIFAKNVYLPWAMLTHWNQFELIDVKVWKRRQADFFQVPFSMVWVFRKKGTDLKRPSASHRDYFRGVWDYPQTEGGDQNSWPPELCGLLIRSFTAEDDLIVDCFAGSALLLGMASYMGRKAIGYEIDKALKPKILENLQWEPEGLIT